MRAPFRVGKASSFSLVSSVVGGRSFPYSPLLELSNKNLHMRPQSLYRCLADKAWFGHGPSSVFSKWFRVPFVGFRPPLWSAAATSESSRRCFLFFLLVERLEAPSPVASSCLALSSEWLKIAPTPSSPEAWQVVMSKSSLVVCGPLRPSL